VRQLHTLHTLPRSPSWLNCACVDTGSVCFVCLPQVPVCAAYSFCVCRQAVRRHTHPIPWLRRFVLVCVVCLLQVPVCAAYSCHVCRQAVRRPHASHTLAELCLCLCVWFASRRYLSALRTAAASAGKLSDDSTHIYTLAEAFCACVCMICLPQVPVCAAYSCRVCRQAAGWL
jgi:hypothetical protein